jgi:hypothetical protein
MKLPERKNDKLNINLIIYEHLIQQKREVLHGKARNELR